ncbi:alpha/beta hydrolase [Donghicola mangrovi]|uniref:Alpha/beta hydrolase n=1 Tax=Donghicola mangrovi TaxID=2729614 RepID=A0A850Q8F6_9RHOB|nr:alpha/beta hydrolase [Donghicola mangrovi]NVO25436.1 alpha/beta hydrolase [Donghicola mangrovi]
MTDEPTITGPHLARRSLLTLTSASFAAYAAASIFDVIPAKAQTMTNDWDKTFLKSDRIDHQKVTFTNRYGIELSGDLYLPKERSGALPAIAISGPFGAVKEQSSGLYAQTLAERGFATLAFDPSWTGESGGQPRNTASPDVNTEDFSAAVDFLGTQETVDRERIGILGICGWGGMALNAAAIDKRIKAVATSTMYDMSRLMAHGYNDSVTLEQRTEMLAGLAAQRWQDVDKGAPTYGPVSLANVPDEAPQFVKEYAAYYRDEARGYHPRSINSNGSFSATTPLSFMNMPLMTYIAEITPRPTLLIHGEVAHSRYFSETAYEAAAEPKELLIVPGATHTDLYDQVEKIPFDKLGSFFGEHLAA